MEIVFWLPSLTNHLVATLHEIQKISDGQITLVIWNKPGRFRRDLGMESASEDGFTVIRLYEGKWWRRANDLLQDYKDAIHVFWGFWAARSNFLLILMAAIRSRKFAIINEPYSTSNSGYKSDRNWIANRIKTIIRPNLYNIARKLIYGLCKGNLPCIFSISLIAQEQFIKAGFKENTIFPYGYFIEKQKTQSPAEKHDSSQLKLVYVGNIIKRKGLDIAIKAIQQVNSENIVVTLDVYGKGNENLLKNEGVEYIHFKGLLPNSRVQEKISEYDFLLLPSRHDGWGVVVNEALLQGVPVILSNRVGAKCLVENSGAGMIFESENIKDLRNTLEKIVLQPDLVKMMKKQAKLVSNKISPAEGATYFIQCLQEYFYSIQSSSENPIWCQKVNYHSTCEPEYPNASL